MPQSADTRSINCIDGLKGIGAIIIAFFWHYQHFSPKIYPFKDIFTISYDYGYLMVDLFFMLSGLGMALGYLQKIQDNQISFPDYIKKRFCKLYPPFVVTLLATVFLQCAYTAQHGTTFVYKKFDLYHFLLNLQLLQNGIMETDLTFNGPAWCISVCMFCYAVFFIVAKKSANERSLFYYCIVGIIIAEWLWNGMTKPLFNIQIAQGIAGFSIGVMLSYAWRYRERFNLHYIARPLLVLLVAGYVTIRIDPNITGNIQHLFILGVCPVIIFCALFNKYLNLILKSRVLVFLGSISLNIYLWHFPVQCAMKILDSHFVLRIDYSSNLCWVSYIAITLLVATIDRYILSKYYRNVFAKFIKRIQKA